MPGLRDVITATVGRRRTEAQYHVDAVKDVHDIVQQLFRADVDPSA
jgi:hypothetical protein